MCYCVSWDSVCCPGNLGGRSNESLGAFVYGYRCRDLVSGADECPSYPKDPETTDSAGMESK